MTKRLSHFEELDLIKGLKSASPDSREYKLILDKLVTHNFGLVHKLVNKFPMKNATCSYEDLFQEGVAGLIHGIEKFDEGRGCRLSTYVYNWISAYVRRYYQNHSRNVRVPVHVSDKQMKLNKQIEQLTSDLGRTPTLEEIRAVNDNVDMVRSSMVNCVSLNAIVGDDSELEAIVGTEDRTEEFESVVDCEFLLSQLRDLVSERDYGILIKRYGLDGEGYRTLNELSQEYDLTRARLHQIEQNLIGRMRSMV